MNSIVIELQRDALDETASIAALLRKARVIAQKLDVPELVNWTELELQGYKDSDKAPPYRRVRGEVKSWNPYNGLMCPIIWTGSPPQHLVTRIIGQSISELIDVIARKETKDVLTISFPEEIGYKLMKESEMPTPPVLVIDRSQIVGILDKVRSLILDWSVKLESQGILGEGMTFSRDEKNKATQSHNIHIGTFQGILGDVTHSTVTQNLRMSVRKGDFESLASHLKSAGVKDDELNELRDAVSSDGHPASPTKLGSGVSNWMGKMVSKAAAGTWQVTLGAAGKLLADALKSYYGF